MIRGRILRGIRQSLARSRAMRVFAALLTVSLTLPPQLGVAAELSYARGG